MGLKLWHLVVQLWFLSRPGSGGMLWFCVSLFFPSCLAQLYELSSVTSGQDHLSILWLHFLLISKRLIRFRSSLWYANCRLSPPLLCTLRVPLHSRGWGVRFLHELEVHQLLKTFVSRIVVFFFCHSNKEVLHLSRNLLCERTSTLCVYKLTFLHLFIRKIKKANKNWNCYNT